ncbi:MAG: carboxypeptidase regulatory-like domain-containing protein, partial [Acidobacteriia bacterium]|nr:carboxypeptidase regulatory-like domain-containing protein [Terriglobia bacterium]
MLRISSVVIVLLCAASQGLFAQSGFVRSGDQPIPGATLTATQGNQTVSVVTDQDGHYGFTLLAPGKWTVTIEIFGFETLSKDVDYSAEKGPVNFNLQLKPSRLLERLQQYAARHKEATGSETPSGSRTRASLNNSANRQPGQPVDQELENELNSQQQSFAPPPTNNQGANESFLVSGSLSPGMAQGREPDSGPDMRSMRPGSNAFEDSGAAFGTPNVPGFGGGQGRGGTLGGRGGGRFGPGGFGGAGRR